jgi:hypothetical protein
MSDKVPHVAAAIPVELAAEARELAARLLAADDPESLRKETVDLVQRLTRAGLEAFFLEPVRRLGLGMVTQSMAKMGLSSAASAIGMAISRILGGLSAAQMRQVAALIDETLVDLAVR